LRCRNLWHPTPANFRFETDMDVQLASRVLGAQRPYMTPLRRQNRAVNRGHLVDLPDTVSSNSAYAERAFLIGTWRRGLL